MFYCDPMQVPTKLDPDPDILKFFSLVGLFQKKRQVPERQKTEIALRARVFEIYTSYLVEFHIMTQ
jgi:hypothetical protein